MAIVLELKPEVERELTAKAAACGMSLAEFADQILREEAAMASERGKLTHTGGDLIEASKPFRGLLTNEEIDVLFQRDPDDGRPAGLA